jgi:hypothetical protein
MMREEMLNTSEDQPIFLNDFGNTLLVKGIIYGNGDDDIAMFLPGDELATYTTVWFADADEWHKVIKQTDDPEIYVKDNGGAIKAIIRKSTRQVDEWMRWAVWRRDKFTCVYCGETNKAMTVDHVLAQELGGETVVENMVTSCRWCNKQKANKTIPEWLKYCQVKNVPFTGFEKVPGLTINAR